MKLRTSFQFWGIVCLVVGISNSFIKPVSGFDLVSQSSSLDDTPIVIEADHGLVCDQKENWCEATGNATAVKGEQTLKADKLRAYFESSSNNNTLPTKDTKDRRVGESTLGKGIKRLVAEGQVEILSPKLHGWSEQGEYVAKSGCIKLNGKLIHLKSGQEEISAEEEINYCHPKDSSKAYAQAHGNVKVRKHDRVIQADTLKAYFKDKKNTEGEDSSLEKAEAFGRVKIIAPQHIALAERGEYIASSEDMKLWGKVKITRGQNQLNGEYGYMNLKTGHAEILAQDPTMPNTKVKQRVRALIVPAKKGEANSTILSTPSKINKSKDF